MIRSRSEQVHQRISRRNPNIADLLLNPAFYQPFSSYGGIHSKNQVRKLNAWCHFWNLLNARSHNNVGGGRCACCGRVIAHQNKRKHCVCANCLPGYLKQVARGERQPALVIRRYAA